MHRLPVWVCVAHIFFLASEAMATDISRIKEIVESSGYVWLSEKASGIKQLSPNSHILRAYTELPSSVGGKSVILILENGVVTQIDDPVWSGDSVSFDLSDINSDGRMDIVVNEYYEPKFHIRIFFKHFDGGYVKVLAADSINLPEFIEIGDICNEGKNVRELILTKDPYGYWHPSLLFPILYVFNGNSYIERSAVSDAQAISDC